MVTVISLFDGMSCGQIALDQLGIKVAAYYASEVDTYAMKVTKHNYPNTIHIGDVSKIRVRKHGNTIRLTDAFGIKHIIRSKIWLIGGSPCQGFSFAGKQKGAATKCNIEITTLEQYLVLKEQGFEFEGQSYLFWEYVRIQRAIEPDIFLLENVIMAKKWKAMFDVAMGVEAIKINSALVSAQNRKRYYWTNIKRVRTPRDRGILLKDILIDDGIGIIKNKGNVNLRNKKSMCLDAHYYKGVDNHGQRTMIHIADATDISSKARGFNKGSVKTEKTGTMTSCSWQENNHVSIDEGLTYRKLTPPRM